jgi:hypothetical protein
MSDYTEWKIQPKVMSWSYTFHGVAAELAVTEQKAPWRTRLRYWLRLATAPVCRTNFIDLMELARLRMREDENRQFFGFSSTADGDSQDD